MKIAVLGTGMVGNALATKLVQIGHQVRMGSRSANSEAGQNWLRSVAGKGQIGTFADAAAFGEVIFDCTNGANSIAALRAAGAGNLRRKVLLQVGNPLDFSNGMPPTLTVCNTDSLGEQVQREFLEALVVKVLNTVNCEVMVQPSVVPGDHDLFLCGNDGPAKTKVTGWLCDWFGWKSDNIIDLGDITASRGMEMWMPLWLRLYSKIGHPHFNLRLMIGSR
ncbi:MAG TPA: NAD(P)-binding domain-containing protein [Candidatus Limnocylindrales bacterium]|jgi:predicted dinucleotide-binding enzyme|nr:NAD(P)-binding domain-containing protein [Candidatus Limnocylindrales bacterium]